MTHLWQVPCPLESNQDGYSRTTHLGCESDHRPAWRRRLMKRPWSVDRGRTSEPRKDYKKGRS